MWYLSSEFAVNFNVVNSPPCIPSSSFEQNLGMLSCQCFFKFSEAQSVNFWTHWSRMLKGGILIFSFDISPFPDQKEISMWTGSTNSVEPGSSLDRLNKLCWAWLLIGQNFVPGQSGDRLNRACLTGLLIANLHPVAFRGGGGAGQE